MAKQLDVLREMPGRDELTVTVLHVHEEIDTPADEAGRSVIESINEDLDSLQGVPEAVYHAVKKVENSEYWRTW